jgi:hypothetical protein
VQFGKPLLTYKTYYFEARQPDPGVALFVVLMSAGSGERKRNKKSKKIQKTYQKVNRRACSDVYYTEANINKSALYHGKRLWFNRSQTAAF